MLRVARTWQKDQIRDMTVIQCFQHWRYIMLARKNTRLQRKHNVTISDHVQKDLALEEDLARMSEENEDQAERLRVVSEEVEALSKMLEDEKGKAEKKDRFAAGFYAHIWNKQCEALKQNLSPGFFNAQDQRLAKAGLYPANADPTRLLTAQSLIHTIYKEYVYDLAEHVPIVARNSLDHMEEDLKTEKDHVTDLQNAMQDLQRQLETSQAEVSQLTADLKEATEENSRANRLQGQTNAISKGLRRDWKQSSMNWKLLTLHGSWLCTVLRQRRSRISKKHSPSRSLRMMSRPT